MTTTTTNLKSRLEIPAHPIRAWLGDLPAQLRDLPRGLRVRKGLVQLWPLTWRLKLDRLAERSFGEGFDIRRSWAKQDAEEARP
jgi:hypothetical protein